MSAGFAVGSVIRNVMRGSTLHPAPMGGVDAWWSVVVHADELTRRRGEKLGCLRRLDVVDVLLNLPIAVAVSWDSLSARERRTLTRLPDGVVSRRGNSVVRRATPPVRPEHVVVPARTFRRGLERASAFSTYCARSTALANSVKLAEFELAEASYYGVGIYQYHGEALVEMLAPEPMPTWGETPASWVFSETLYERLSGLDVLAS
jgi:hypothetical protein